MKTNIWNLLKNNRRWSEVEKLGECIEGTGYRIDINGDFVDVPENVEKGDDDYEESQDPYYRGR